MKTEKETLDYIEYLIHHYHEGNVKSMRESIEATIKSYAKEHAIEFALFYNAEPDHIRAAYDPEVIYTEYLKQQTP